MESVTIATAALVRAWRAAGSESLMVLFRGPGTTVELADALARAMRIANDAAERHFEAALVSGTDVTVTPGGPVVFIDFCDERAALVFWLEAVARSLDESGLSGKLVPCPASKNPLGSTLVESISAAASLPVDWAAVSVDQDAGWSAGAPRWYASATDTVAVLDALLPWVLAGEGRTWLRHGLAEVEVATGGVSAIALAALGRNPMLAIARVQSTGRFRRVSFDIFGRLVLQVVEPTSWCVQVDELRELLRQIAPHIELGLVRQAPAPANAWYQVVNRCPPVMPAGLGRTDPLRLIRHLEGQYVTDAYGVQVLTDSQLEKVGDLTGWDVAEVSPGRHLVTAPDLAAWFTGTAPDTTVLQDARIAFGDAVLREEHYDAQPSDWVRADELGRLPGSPWLRAD